MMSLGGLWRPSSQLFFTLGICVTSVVALAAPFKEPLFKTAVGFLIPGRVFYTIEDFL